MKLVRHAGDFQFIKKPSPMRIPYYIPVSCFWIIDLANWIEQV